MSLKTVARTYGVPDRDLPTPQRTFDLNLRLALLSGDLYQHLQHEFSEAFIGQTFVFMQDRRPSVPSGTNEIRLQTERHASTLFGEQQFPDVETADETARQIIKDFIGESRLPLVMRDAAYIGSVGSAAIHMRALGRPGKPLRIFFDVYSTAYLTPTFDPFAPDTLIAVLERYKLKGSDLAAKGYDIAEEDLRETFWFMRRWDEDSEVWYQPWKLSQEKEARDQGRTFTPSVDEVRTPTPHKLGRCPWVWTRTPHAGRDLDGPATWEAGIEHAIALDYQDSQIVAGISYAMSPTTVMELPPTVAKPAEGTVEGALPKTPETIVEVPQGAKVYYLEMDGAGFEQARQKSLELRKAEIEAIHGDRIDPTEITQGHQGAQTMTLINAPFIRHVESLKSVYGPALLDLIDLALLVIRERTVAVRGKIVPAEVGAVTDLNLRWGDIYPLTPAEKLAVAQAHETFIRSGVESRENARKDIAAVFHIADVAAEGAQVAKEQAEEDARIKALKAQVQDRVQLAP